jgi:hypothetical protein
MVLQLATTSPIKTPIQPVPFAQPAELPSHLPLRRRRRGNVSSLSVRKADSKRAGAPESATLNSEIPDYFTRRHTWDLPSSGKPT